MTSARKVSELFTAAGEAFTKLAKLVLILQTSIESAEKNDSNGDFLNNADSSCWTTHDTELLQTTVKRFGDDINIISEHIKDKTMCQIKSTFKKISTASGKSQDSTSNGASAANSTSKLGSGFQEVNNLSTTVNSTDSISGNRSVSVTETLTLKNNEKATSSTMSGESSSLSTQINASTASTSTAAGSICASPSPFLHYPLLRKSADITLNMLNARDDSDDENRMTGLSVFNST